MANPTGSPQAGGVRFDPFAGPQLASATASTEPQREIWTACQLGPEASLAFNESISLEMRGALDLGALRASLGDLVRRHEALRATFTSDGLMFCVLEDAAVPFEVVDLAGLAGEAQQAERAGVLAREVETPFDLEKGPLARVVVLRLAADAHVVVVTAHHIVVDGWSWSVLVGDWARLYGARRGGRPAELPPADRFSDYATDQAAYLRSAELAADEAYWLKQFAGELPVLDLPSDRVRPAVKTFAARRVDVGLDAELVRALKQAGAREGASWFTVLLAGFTALVHRLTGQQDLVVGIPAAGQAATGRTALVGHCVNTLPLRSHVEGERPFRELLRAMRGTVLDAFEHQQHTFGSLLRKLPLPRDPSRQPLVSTVFNLDQAIAAETLAFEGLEVRFLSNPRHFETFDLFVNAVDGPAGLLLECQYNTDLFDEATVRRFVSGFESLLRAVVDAPARAVADLPLLRPDERERILVEWNQTAKADTPADSIHELVREQARLRPDAAALLHGDTQLSYGELELRSNQLARRLRALGVSPDQPVGLCLERSFDVVVALLGILKAGGAYLPLEHNYPKERLAFMLDDAAVRLVVTQSSLASVLPESSGRLLLLDQEREAIAQESGEPLAAEGGGSLAYITYTSGSTGRPKGVLIPQRAVIRLVRGVDYVRLGPETTLIHCANLAFDASTFEIWGALLNGGRCALHPETVPTGAGLAATIRGNAVTTAFLTTALFNALVDEDPGLFEGLRQLYVGGEALSVPHVRRFLEARPEVELSNAYGPTETTTFATTCRLRGPLAPGARSLPIGRPIRDTRLYVLDARLQPVPVGVTGELYIGGERLARGYLARPELTAERFLADPFVPGGRVYRTGDLVRYLPDGSVDFLGRADGQVKIRGFRIELGEIEAALASHPGVAQAAVLARQDRPGDKVLVAYVVPQAGSSASDEELLAHLRQSLPKFMIPQHVVRLERMPLNASGKLDRRALPAPERREDEAAAYEAPHTPTEVMLAGLWEKALGLRRVGLHDDFFTLGGHSLLAAQVLSRLNREHGIVLPFRTIFEAPTVARFAALIDGRSHEERQQAIARIPRRQDAVPAPVSLMQERILLLEELDPDRRLVHNVPSAFRLEGPLDASALERALNDVVARQESLRTTFHKQDGAYRQIVARELVLRLESRDLGELPAAEREQRVRELVRDETARAFDLEHGPLFRAFLLRLADDEHLLFTLRHNAVWDGWSFDIFRHELSAFYAARTGSGPAALAELPVSYSDFAAWHRQWLEGPEAAKQLSFWRERLAGGPAAIELPTDRPRANERDYAGVNEWIEIPRAEADAVAELGRQLGATSFMVLLAAFNVLLHRYTGQRDVLVACPVRNRPRPEIEDVVGLFTNTLMLRNQVDPAESFAELVKRVRATTLDAFSHQELPFERLAGEAPPVRVLFSLQEGRHRETALGAVKLSLPHLVSPAIAVDMNFWFVEMKHGLAGALNYSTQLFDPETIRRFIAHYRGLLRSALRDASQPVGRLAMVDGVEPGAQRAAAPSAPAEGDADRLAELLAGAPAADAEPARVAGWLRSRGVEAGDRVGVRLGTTRLVPAVLGLSRLGAVPIPLDESEPPVRLRARLSAAGAQWLWADADTLAEAEFDSARSLPPADLSGGAEPLHHEPVEAPATAWIATSFGPDGACTAAAVAWRSVLPRLTAAAQHLGLGEGQTLAISGGASAFVSLLPLVAGARSVVAHEDDTADGEALRALLEREAADGFVGPAGLWRRLLASDWPGKPGFVAVFTDAARPELVDKLLALDAAVFAAWGVEEAGDWCGLQRLESSDDGAFIATPLPGVALQVLEPSREPAPAGVPGELVVVPTAAVGEASPTAIPTGERVRQKADGRLERRGRLDGRVRVLGSRVELPEVRLRLLEHEAVRDAAVVLRDDAPGEPRLVAYVVAAAGAAFTDTELRRHLRRSLAPQAVPQHVVSVEALPRRPDGGLDLRRLPTPFATRRRESRPPQSEEEKLLVALYSETLGVPDVGLEDNFFDLGGHSLLGLQLVARVEAQTRRRLKPRLLLLSTLGQVAAELARTEARTD